MVDSTEIKARLEFRKQALTRLRAAYLALIDGGVKTYTIADRQLTRYDLPDIKDEIDELEDEIDELEGLLSNTRPRKAFGIIPRDW